MQLIKDPLPQKIDDDKQFPSIQDNIVSKNNSDDHTNLINDDNNRDLKVSNSKSNSNYHYATTGTLAPKQRNKIDGTMVNDSWDMIDNMPHIKERVNTGKS